MGHLPRCIECGAEFSVERAKLGYKTCHVHGEKRKKFTVAPGYNKGSYQLITASCIKDIGKK